MRILSIRRGLEADHSSTHTEHIHGVTITESYDSWTCEFTLPYTAKLFQKLAEYEASGDCSLDFAHQGNQIVVSFTALLDYGAIAGDDAYIALANYCLDVKDDILAGDFSDLELLKAYVEGSKAEFAAMHSSSGIEHILERI